MVHSDETLREFIIELCSDDDNTHRRLARHRISELGRPKQALLWGGRHVVFTWIYVSVVITTPFAIGAIALGYNVRSQPLPGGAWCLAIWAAVVVAGPLIARGARTCGIARSKRITPAAFVSTMRERAPAIPEQFVLAVRAAIGAIYEVPVDLIGPRDTRRRVKSLSLISEPLALEMVARLDRALGLQLTVQRICQVADTFAGNPAKTVAEMLMFTFDTLRTAEGRP